MTMKSTNPTRQTAILVGALFIINFVANMIGSMLILDPIISSPDYLTNLDSNRGLVIFGELLELICAVAVIGIAVYIYPVLKRYNENIARGYFAIRIIEIAMMLIAIIIAFLLLALSAEYTKGGNSDAPYFETLGTIAVAGRYWAFKLVLICYIFGGLMLFYLFYQSKLISRFISVWGLIVVLLMLTANVLEISGYHNFSPTEIPGMIFYLPGFPLEVFLGFWLIFKGFNFPSILNDKITSTQH
jgi:Domain of unknown function (DUF4386)